MVSKLSLESYSSFDPMAEGKQPFTKGSSINRTPLFSRDNYPLSKIIMKIFIESLDRGVWQEIVTGPYVPKNVIDGQTVDKPSFEWSDSESKKAQFDCMAKNTITSALNLDEFFRASQCSLAKEMWDILEVTHEGSSDVKRTRKHC